MSEPTGTRFENPLLFWWVTHRSSRVLFSQLQLLTVPTPLLLQPFSPTLRTRSPVEAVGILTGPWFRWSQMLDQCPCEAANNVLVGLFLQSEPHATEAGNDPFTLHFIFFTSFKVLKQPPQHTHTHRKIPWTLLSNYLKLLPLSQFQGKGGRKVLSVWTRIFGMRVSIGSEWSWQMEDGETTGRAGESKGRMRVMHEPGFFRPCNKRLLSSALCLCHIKSKWDWWL